MKIPIIYAKINYRNFLSIMSEKNNKLDEVKILANTLKMYKKTLDEMINIEKAKDFDKHDESFERHKARINDEIISISDKMCDILNDVPSDTVGSNQFVDALKKEERAARDYEEDEKSNKSLFDAIDKHGNDEDFGDEICHRIEVRKRRSEEASKDDKLVTTEAFDEKKSFIHEMQNIISETEWLHEYSFLMKLPKEYDIPVYAIKSFFKNLDYNQLWVTVNDYVRDGIPLEAILEKNLENINDQPKSDIEIDYVKSDGKTVYKEILKDVKLVSSNPSTMSYDGGNIKNFNLGFTYKKRIFE